MDIEIEPYDETLNNMSCDKIKRWAEGVLESLRKECELKNDKFIFLAGENYRKFLLPHIENYEIPMFGLSIGKQLQWLNERLEKI